jgi:hypothetical protein
MSDKSSSGSLAATESPTAHISNHLRKNSSVIISVESLRKQEVVPTAIPGETKRKESLKNNGNGRKNLINMMSKQVGVNQKDKELRQTVDKEITKESVIKKTRQDKIVDVFFKAESPLMQSTTPKSRVKKSQKKPHSEKQVDRGNLSYFLTNSNFKEPKCLTKEKEKAQAQAQTARGKYDTIDTRLRTHQTSSSSSPFHSDTNHVNFAYRAPTNTRTHPHTTTTTTTKSQLSPTTPSCSSRIHTKKRVPPNQREEPETTLLPYPHDMNKRQSQTQSQLQFSDVWKKVETKDIFTHVKR